MILDLRIARKWTQGHSTNVFRRETDPEPDRPEAVGNLLCLEVSSAMAWHCFLGSEGSWGTESLQMIGQCGFRLLEENYVSGASGECVFSAGVEGIPFDKTWALFSYEAKRGGGGDDVLTYIVQMYLHMQPQLQE